MRIVFFSVPLGRTGGADAGGGAGVAGRSDPFQRGFAILYGIMACASLVQVLSEVLTRYRWEIALMMLVFTALAPDEVWQRARSRRWVR